VLGEKKKKKKKRKKGMKKKKEREKEMLNLAAERSAINEGMRDKRGAQ